MKNGLVEVLPLGGVYGAGRFGLAPQSSMRSGYFEAAGVIGPDRQRPAQRTLRR